MKKFYLLLHEDPAVFAGVSPAEMQAIIGRYSEWRNGLAAQGSVVGGHKLEDGTGRVLRSGTVHDGPFTEGKEVIGGLFIIQAAGFDEAVAIARTCPHCD